MIEVTDRPTGHRWASTPHELARDWALLGHPEVALHLVERAGIVRGTFVQESDGAREVVEVMAVQMRDEVAVLCLRHVGGGAEGHRRYRPGSVLFTLRVAEDALEVDHRRWRGPAPDTSRFVAA